MDMDELGYRWDEIERNGKNTRCCGVGGMMCTSNPELYERVYTRRASDFNQQYRDLLRRLPRNHAGSRQRRRAPP